MIIDGQLVIQQKVEKRTEPEPLPEAPENPGQASIEDVGPLPPSGERLEWVFLEPQAKCNLCAFDWAVWTIRVRNKDLTTSQSRGKAYCESCVEFAEKPDNFERFEFLYPYRKPTAFGTTPDFWPPLWEEAGFKMPPDEWIKFPHEGAMGKPPLRCFTEADWEAIKKKSFQRTRLQGSPP